MSDMVQFTCFRCEGHKCAYCNHTGILSRPDTRDLRDYLRHRFGSEGTAYRRVAVETLGFNIVTDPNMPSDEISFRDESGKEIGRIVGLEREGK